MAFATEHEPGEPTREQGLHDAAAGLSARLFHEADDEVLGVYLDAWIEGRKLLGPDAPPPRGRKTVTP